MTDKHPSLDEQMADAVRRQFDHATASHRVDRVGWTRQQWVDDARRLMEDLHGSVLDLVNGHAVYMLEEIDFLKAQLAAQDRRAIEADVLHERTEDAKTGLEDR